MMELAPGPYFKTAPVVQYKQLYFEGLRRLDPQRTVARMEDLSGGKDVALLCYEAPTDDQYCHRAYISCWLHDSLGIEVFEYGYEEQGCGWRHPKLPAQFRQLPGLARLDVSSYLGATATDKLGRTWTVVGVDESNVDQALIESEERRASISADILHEKFQPTA